MAKSKAKNKKMIYLVVVIAIVLIIAFLYINNNYLTVSEYLISNCEIPEEFDGYRIVQLSDLHSKYFGEKQKNLIRKIDELKPDIIVLTGDLYDERTNDDESSINAAVDLISGLSKNYDIYYVTGNHENTSDYHYDFEDKIRGFDNVYHLRGEKIPLRKGNSEIYLQGIEDISFSYNRKNYYKNLIEMSDNSREGYNILLSHRPYMIEDFLPDSNFDLIFCGHNHGGQIEIPIILPNGLYSPSEGWFPKYTKGHHILDDNDLILNRGLGPSKFPFRVFNSPEIVCVELKSE